MIENILFVVFGFISAWMFQLCWRWIVLRWQRRNNFVGCAIEINGVKGTIVDYDPDGLTVKLDKPLGEDKGECIVPHKTTVVPPLPPSVTFDSDFVGIAAEDLKDGEKLWIDRKRNIIWRARG